MIRTASSGGSNAFNRASGLRLKRLPHFESVHGSYHPPGCHDRARYERRTVRIVPCTALRLNDFVSRVLSRR